jgi:large subunit ribosomal protein L5
MAEKKTDKVEEAVEAVKAKAEEVAEDVKAKAEEVAEDVKAKAEEVAEDVKAKAKTVKAKVEKKVAEKAPKAEKKADKAADGRKLPNLKAKYQADVAPALMQKFGYKSVMQIPRLDKIVVNCGCGEARENSKVLEAVVGDLTKITGQKAIITKAKKSVANFKLREEMPIGAKVTLRGDRMWEFLDRLFNVALPRVRDFRGINPNSFDGRGNYALGIKEQLIFPEIEYDKIDKIRGMDVVLCTTANTDEEARELLTLIGAPFAAQA